MWVTLSTCAFIGKTTWENANKLAVVETKVTVIDENQKKVLATLPELAKDNTALSMRVITLEDYMKANKR